MARMREAAEREMIVQESSLILANPGKWEYYAEKFRANVSIGWLGGNNSC
jgi:hypothetical protein